ncbi:MAG: hypothetical protein KUG82_12640 [Pseudomonadales bacterium]|nr:hypothetical protein [Pseudomonadales bacterium]
MGQFSFDPGFGGYEKFGEYLEKTKDIPTKFLLDIIEEDFKQDSIPKLRGKDRLAVVERFEARLFRGAEYTSAITQGKDSDNKHKEQMLFSSVMNPEILTPWMEKLIHFEVPLVGIWSVPLIVVKLLPHFKIKTQHSLIISQQVPSSLRQSFYENGKLIFSRQSKIKFDLREVHDAVSYTVLLANEIEHTEHYLINHRLVRADEKISVCCLVRDDFVAEIHDYLESTHVFDYKVFSIAALEKKFGYKREGAKYSDLLFSRICQQLPARSEHYAKPTERRFYTEFNFKRILYDVSVMSLFFAVIFTLLTVFDGIAYRTEANEVMSMASRVDAAYETEFAKDESLLRRADSIKYSVQISEAIKKDSQIEPKSFYLEMSRIITRPQYSGLSIDRIHWEKERESKAMVFKDRIYPEGYDPYLNIEEKMDEGDPSTQHKVHLAIVKGKVSLVGRTYRSTIAMINGFISDLEKHPQVLAVDVVELPIDLRPTSKYSDFSGVSRLVNATDNVTEGYFRVRVVMQDIDHV